MSFPKNRKIADDDDSEEQSDIVMLQEVLSLETRIIMVENQSENGDFRLLEGEKFNYFSGLEVNFEELYIDEQPTGYVRCTDSACYMAASAKSTRKMMFKPHDGSTKYKKALFLRHVKSYHQNKPNVTAKKGTLNFFVKNKKLAP